MKRLLALSCLLFACDDVKPHAPASRVESISAKRTDDSVASLCDVVPEAAARPVFTFPKLEGPAPADVKGFRWVNLWATWCPPCIEELPRLRTLLSSLHGAGANVTLQMVSVDRDAEVVVNFAKQHPEVGGSLRMSDPMALQPWLGSIGLDSGATLPVHIFVAPDNKVACVRTGAIRESDLPALTKLLSP